MKNICRIVMYILFILSCKDDRELNYPLIQTGEVTGIDSAGVTFHANVVDLSMDAKDMKLNTF